MKTNRLVQLIARYIGLALVAIAAMVTPELGEDQKAQIADYAATIAAGGAGFVVLVWDLLIHRFNNGGIFDAPQNKGNVSPRQARSR